MLPGIKYLLNEISTFICLVVGIIDFHFKIVKNNALPLTSSSSSLKDFRGQNKQINSG